MENKKCLKPPTSIIRKIHRCKTWDVEHVPGEPCHDLNLFPAPGASSSARGRFRAGEAMLVLLLGLEKGAPAPTMGILWGIHWIGLRENLQETMVFTIKYRAFL